MGTEKTVSAKISRPRLSGEVRRERLFHLLDARMQRPAVWVSAGAGSGKTTLIASYLDAQHIPCLWYQCDEGDADLATFFYYMGQAAKKAAPKRKIHLPLLTPEYLSGLPTFARRYFEKLCAVLSSLPAAAAAKGGPGNFAIVLDNYQDVPAGSPLQEMIATSLDILPENFHAIVISRGDPPPAFARLQANGKIGLLGHEDLRFTWDEVRELTRGRLPDRDEKQLKSIYKITEGWVAGIILMLEQTRLKGAVPRSPETDEYENVFGYFAGEIFSKSEREVQDFLLKASFLPVLSVALAEKLTGTANAGRILTALSRRNYFTERLSGKRQDFQFHPLFRSFLLSRARSTSTPAELAGMQKEAGLLLEQDGQIEDAARLYAEAGEARSLAAMVVRHAREFLKQGRYRTVSEWIAAIPNEVAEADPWFLYWAGMCAFLLDMPRARECLEKAWTLFEAAGDVAGLYLSWAGIFDAHLYTMGDWGPLERCIATFEDLRRRHPSFPSRDVEMVVSSRGLISLVLRNDGRIAQMEEWLARVSSFQAEDPSLDAQMDAAFYMSLYFLWQGAYERNAVLLERIAADALHRHLSPLAAIRIKLMQGIHAWITARYDAALKTLTSGLELAKKSGVHVFDSLLWSFQAAAQMAGGELKQAQKSLLRQEESLRVAHGTLDVFFYHINRAWQALLQGKPSLAAGYLEAVSVQLEKIGTPYYQALWHIGMAQASYGQGRREEAQEHAATALRIGLGMQSHVLEWYSRIIGAWLLLQEDREEEGLAELARGFLLGRRHDYVHLEFYQPAVMQLLCAKALEHGIEPDYAKGLIRRLALAPPAGGSCREDWPCPLTIRTLGGFEIIKNDAPLPSGGKVQKKPLDLLKALIAAGGANVPVKDLTDELWPDATGDMASKSFETTLSRLRRLLGENRFLKYAAGQLSLDSQACRVDSLALEGVLREAQKAPPGRFSPLWEKAFALYQGPFLPSESQPWAAQRRETLKNGVLRCAIAAGRHHEQENDWEQAAAWWARGLALDDLTEYFYQRLMVCHAKLGNNADAAKAYNRCRCRLRDQLGIAPSTETDALYSSLLAQR